MKPLIIFDCFDTLLSIPKATAYSAFLSKIELNSRHYYRNLMTKSNIDWYSLVSSDIDIEVYQKAVEELKAEIYNENSHISGVIAIDSLIKGLVKLRENYVVVLFSNLAQGYEIKIEEYIKPYIDQCFYSFEVGIQKPDKAFLDHIVSWYQIYHGTISLDKITLVDDKLKNITAARDYGVKGILIDNSGILPLEKVFKDLMTSI